MQGIAGADGQGSFILTLQERIAARKLGAGNHVDIGTRHQGLLGQGDARAQTDDQSYGQTRHPAIEGGATDRQGSGMGVCLAIDGVSANRADLLHTGLLGHCYCR